MNQILHGNILEIAPTLPAQSVHCIVTSPPYYGLRDYGADGQIGLESTPEEYIAKMVALFGELRRVLRDDGTLWLNLGDSYTAGAGSRNGTNLSGLKKNVKNEETRQRLLVENKIYRGDSFKEIVTGLPPKNLPGIPWRVALALQADGWYLRSDIIWAKPNPMPESVTDRPTKAHEYIFLLSKSERYYYDAEAVRENLADERMGNPGAYKWSYANDPQTGKGIRGNGGPSVKLQNEGWNSNGKVTGRNRRTVWTVATQPYSGAHFATFPPKLIEPCILAGCPAEVCSECGAPVVRVVETIATKATSRAQSFGRSGNVANHILPGQSAAQHRPGRDSGINQSVTTGFTPTCQCNAPTVPGVVLDPFFGSGTVGQVAIETGRQWLGVELNPEYIKLANQRIAAAQPALIAPSGAVPPNNGLHATEQARLF